MDAPEPDPPTLPGPMPAIYKSDDELYGAHVKIVKAPEAGYTEVEEHQMDESTRKLVAKVWYFRFNSLSSCAIRACEGSQVQNGSYQAAVKWKQYNNRERQWRNAQLGMPSVPESKNLDSYWFINWVSSEVSHHDWKSSMANIQLHWHRVDKDGPIPGNVDKDEAKRTASDAFVRNKADYIARLQARTTIELPECNVFRVGKKRKDEILRYLRERIQERVTEVQSFDPFPETTAFQSLQHIPDDWRSYKELTAVDKLNFMDKAANKNVYASFYAPLADAVSVAANFEDQDMAELMYSTVLYTAIAAEFHYIRAYHENERFARKYPTLINPSPLPLYPDQVRATFETIQQTSLKSIPNFPSNIQNVLVPDKRAAKAKKPNTDGANTKKRPREMPEGEAPRPRPEEISGATGERFKRARI